MEPKAALVQWDGDVLELWSSNQGMTGMRQSLSAITGVPEERIRVHAEDVGGAFGIRAYAYPEYAALALASRRTGATGQVGIDTLGILLERLPRPCGVSVGRAGA